MEGGKRFPVLVVLRGLQEGGEIAPEALICSKQGAYRGGATGTGRAP